MWSKYLHRGVSVVVMLTGLVVVGFADKANAQIGYWDLFAVNLTPNGPYWSLVNRGTGALPDPLVQPDPAGNHVIDAATPLGGIAWGFGGFDYGTGTLESKAGAFSIQLMGASQYYVSVVLDTATSPHNNGNYGSWGTVSDIVVTPWTATGWGDPIVPNWVISPFDPDNGTVVNGGASSTITLAINDFGDAEGNGQAIGIWGASAELPSALGYKVDFVTDVNTWDSYDIPEPATMSLVVLGGLTMLRRRVRAD